MILNPHVCVDRDAGVYVDRFYPEAGYAIWRDNEEGNLNEAGEPVLCYAQYNCQKRFSEQEAPHIHAKWVEDGMTVV